MRTMRTLGTLVVVGGTVALAYGCSAAGNAPIGNDAADGSTSPGDYGSGNSDASTGTTPSPKKDAGSGGGAYDAGVVAKAPEGSPCDLATAVGDPESTESCGLCGNQSRACLSPDGGAAGAVWAAWGACNGEVTGANACDPSKTYTATPCGNCGTVPQVCDPGTCNFETGFDCTEPTNACHPTDTKFILGASCAVAGQGRLYTCGATCTLGSPGACEAPPPNPHSLTISATVGAAVTANFSLTASSTTQPIDAECPADIDTFSDPVSYIDIGIVNPTSRTVTVSLWDGPTSGTTSLDTIMSWYPTPLFPPPDVTACTSASDDCSPGADCANTSSISGYSGLSGTSAASIPPNGTITLYVAAYDSGVTGNFTLHAKTEN